MLDLDQVADPGAGGLDALYRAMPELRISGVRSIAETLGVSVDTARAMIRNDALALPVDRQASRVRAQAGELLRWRAQHFDGLADRLVGLPAIGRLAGLDPLTVKRYAADPATRFPARKVGGRWWASRRAVMAWCAERLGSEAAR